MTAFLKNYTKFKDAGDLEVNITEYLDKDHKGNYVTRVKKEG